MNKNHQESESSNSSPLSSNGSGGSQATTASLENGHFQLQQIGETKSNGLRQHPTNQMFIEETQNGFDDSGYLALDQLLASLALENDIMERHLSQINNNNTEPNPKFQMKSQTVDDVFSFETAIQKHPSSHEIYAKNGKQNGYDENLNDVLANLLEFSENELLPQHQQQQQHNSLTNGNGHLINDGMNYHHSNNSININLNNNHISNSKGQHQANTNHINNNNYIMANGHHHHHHSVHHTSINNTNYMNHRAQMSMYHEPSNNAIKRLTSESENSSSVSPSLSERSNGVVSWTDQVCVICANP